MNNNIIQKQALASSMEHLQKPDKSRLWQNQEENRLNVSELKRNRIHRRVA